MTRSLSCFYFIYKVERSEEINILLQTEVQNEKSPDVLFFSSGAYGSFILIIGLMAPTLDGRPKNISDW